MTNFFKVYVFFSFSTHYDFFSQEVQRLDLEKVTTDEDLAEKRSFADVKRRFEQQSSGKGYCDPPPLISSFNITSKNSRF